MNLYYVLTKRYEKKRLFDRNENKPKIYRGEAQRRRTNPILPAVALAKADFVSNFEYTKIVNA
jgi:hypothetical protein